MSDTWTIAGESGKSVNATARPLEDLNIQGLRVNFLTMGVSTLTWTVDRKSVV